MDVMAVLKKKGSLTSLTLCDPSKLYGSQTWPNYSHKLYALSIFIRHQSQRNNSKRITIIVKQ